MNDGAVGGRIRHARTERGLKQVEAAEQAGIRAHTLWRYEAGKMVPSVAALQRLAGVLRVRLEWLASGRGVMAADMPSIPPPPSNDDEGSHAA